MCERTDILLVKISEEMRIKEYDGLSSSCDVSSNCPQPKELISLKRTLGYIHELGELRHEREQKERKKGQEVQSTMLEAISELVEIIKGNPNLDASGHSKRIKSLEKYHPYLKVWSFISLTMIGMIATISCTAILAGILTFTSPITVVEKVLGIK